MKKLLTILSAFVITAGSGLSIVSCGGHPKPDDSGMTEAGQKWLKNAIPKLYKNDIAPNFTTKLTIGDNAKADIKVPIKDFFAGFTYNQSMDNIPSKAKGYLLTYLDTYLKTHQNDFITWLKTNDNAAYTTQFLSSVPNFITIDKSLTTISTIKNLWDIRQNPKDFQAIAGLNKDRYSELFTKFQKEGNLPEDIYTINIKLVFDISYKGDDPNNLAQTKIAISNENPLVTTLIDIHGIDFYNFCVNEATGEIPHLLNDYPADFIFDINDLKIPGFTFEQNKNTIITKLQNNLNTDVFSTENGFDISVKKLEVTSLGEWGQIDNNILKDQSSSESPWLDGENYFFSKITKIAQSDKSGFNFLSPVDKDTFADTTGKTFTSNEKMFSGSLNKDIATFKIAHKAPGNWTDTQYTWLPDGNKDAKHKINFATVLPNIISYGTFKITDWGPTEGGRPFGTSWDIPFFITNNKMTPKNSQSAREAYYTGMVNPLSHVLSAQEGSLFDVAKKDDLNHASSPTVVPLQIANQYSVGEMENTILKAIDNSKTLDWGDKKALEWSANIVFAIIQHQDTKLAFYPGYIAAVDTPEHLAADGKLKEGFVVQNELNKVYGRYITNVSDETTRKVLQDSNSSIYLGPSSTEQTNFSYIDLPTHYGQVDAWLQYILAIWNFVPADSQLKNPTMYATSPFNKSLITSLFKVFNKDWSKIGFNQYTFDLLKNSIPKTYLTVGGLTINLSPAWDFDYSYSVGNYLL